MKPWYEIRAGTGGHYENYYNQQKKNNKESPTIWVELQLTEDQALTTARGNKEHHMHAKVRLRN